MYYLLNKTQYAVISDNLSHEPAWSLDKSKCIAHVDNGLEITEYEEAFANKDAVDEYKQIDIRFWELSDAENFFDL